MQSPHWLLSLIATAPKIVIKSAEFSPRVFALFQWTTEFSHHTIKFSPDFETTIMRAQFFSLLSASSVVEQAGAVAG